MKRFVPLIMLSAACVDAETTPCSTTPKLPVMHSGIEVAGPSGLDPKAIDTMMKHARESKTDAIIVLRDGKIAIEEYFADGKRPIVAMSASKSIASIAIGALAQRDPKLSLDEPIVKTFPGQEADEQRSKITLRHLMSHTSGVAPDRAQVMKGEGLAKHFWSSPMPTKPGEDFVYNNNAVDFLSSYVHARTKRERLDDFLQTAVFGPVGVRGASWMKDDFGEPRAAGELFIEPLELAKLGQLMLQDGVWEGKRLLREGWVAESTKPSQSFNESCGLLWWLDAKQSATLTSEIHASMEKNGVSHEIVSKLKPLVGRSFPSSRALRKELMSLLTNAEAESFMDTMMRTRLRLAEVKLLGPVRAYNANGQGGQYVVVVPSKKMVAVRMREAGDDDDWSEQNDYAAFMKDVRALTGDLED